jgi:chemotaxis protein CheD
VEVSNFSYVKIGEVKTGRKPDILKATLGSCVGIAFIWPEKGLFALAHCLLPIAPENSSELGAKYVTQAIPSLIKLMGAKPENFGAIEVYLTGGANMVESTKGPANPNHIGVQNSETAERLLRQKGFKIKKMEVGGIAAKQITIDCTTGTVEMSEIKDGVRIKVE